MDTALTQKFPFILDRNLAKANCTGNHVCTSGDTVVLWSNVNSLARASGQCWAGVLSRSFCPQCPGLGAWGQT